MEKQDTFRVVVLIPAYKPDERLLELVHRLHDETEYNLIVVNDGSGSEFDAVFAALPSYVTLLSHAVNQGKGRAMKTGFSYILENLPDSQGVIIVDADGQRRRAACMGGMLSVLDGEVRLVATTWEWAEDIDQARAEASKKRAEEILAKKNLDKRDYEMAQARLKRALVRTSVH